MGIIKLIIALGLFMTIAFTTGYLVGLSIPRPPTFAEDVYHNNEGYVECNKNIKKMLDK